MLNSNVAPVRAVCAGRFHYVASGQTTASLPFTQFARICYVKIPFLELRKLTNYFIWPIQANTLFLMRNQERMSQSVKSCQVRRSIIHILCLYATLFLTVCGDTICDTRAAPPAATSRVKSGIVSIATIRPMSTHPAG